MFDNRTGRCRRIELRHELIGSVRIIDVVVGKLLALKLQRRGNAEALLMRRVERRLLVRVLAVPQLLAQGSGQAAPPGRFGDARFRGFFREPSRYRRIIGGGAGKGDLSEPAPGFTADASAV